MRRPRKLIPPAAKEVSPNPKKRGKTQRKLYILPSLTSPPTHTTHSPSPSAANPAKRIAAESEEIPRPAELSAKGGKRSGKGNF